MASTLRKQYLASRSLRLGAFIIDILILGMIGQLLGLVFEFIFVHLGLWGRLVGFSIALLYFGIGNSSKANGQTIGKKLLGIQVVGTNNAPISLGRSLLRYTILGLPFFLNGIALPNTKIQAVLIYPLTLVIVGGMLSILYLFLFNRATGQSLHDLIAKTYVVNIDMQKHSMGQLRRVHLIVVAIIATMSTTLPIFTHQLASSEPFQELFVIRDNLVQQPNVTNASVSKNKNITIASSGEQETTNSIFTQISVTNDKIDQAKFARRLATIVAANYNNMTHIDAINVTLVYGFDIGIASRWQSYAFQFAPDEITDNPTIYY